MSTNPYIKQTFNIQKQSQLIRKDFPLLNLYSGDNQLHYLDNAATSQKPQQVIDAISDCYQRVNAPVHRGLYALADESTTTYEKSRKKVAQFIGAPQSEQLIFTLSATESINMVAQGWLKHHLNAGDKVWVTGMEHHANLVPWQRVCKETGAELCFIELTEDGSLDLDNATELYSEKTRFIAMSHVSNVLGVINPVKEVTQRAAQAGIPVLIDATQSVGHIPVDVVELDCDFLAFSAHKMYGPTGIGALYGKADKLATMEPMLLGGGMVDEVGDYESSWASLPSKLEAGSPNLAGAIGFASAVDYIESIGLQTIESIVSELTEKALFALSNINGIKIYGPLDSERREGIISFNLDGIHPHDIAQIAGESNVAIRSGHHCCQPLMRRLGEVATVRASFAPYNIEEEINALLEVIETAQSIFMPR
ncbi:cysteine desulfurase [Cocleimonas flava]|uniref:Cysteine desulfurase n=1 Tax=Cocleimonas flava TaxID=634765 RepID=A0A4R1EYE5_9GAMM|nr:SufS family cysteine desulfurase [Cocleimonas flava]TCJ83041.1 cysteine desulfurase/selenocysteine lyase [Cocleimonas flava]